MVVPENFSSWRVASTRTAGSAWPIEQEWVAARLGSLDSAQRHVVKTFLTELLMHCRDDAKLRQLWNNTDTDFYIAGDQAGRYFLTLIRDSIQ